MKMGISLLGISICNTLLSFLWKGKKDALSIPALMIFKLKKMDGNLGFSAFSSPKRKMQILILQTIKSVI